MDPQAFIRLSIGSLGLRLRLGESTLNSSNPKVDALSSPCSCEIRLRGFPVQKASVPVVTTPEITTTDSHNVASSFYLQQSDVKALLKPRCFSNPRACIEIAVFRGKKGLHCGVGTKKQQVGTYRLEANLQWGEGKPVTLFNGWVGIGKPGEVELRLRIKLDPDPRYVFRFQDLTTLSPQILQLQGSIKQPIFSCKFIRDRVSEADYRQTSVDPSNLEVEIRERKGWKVTIHDLSGSAVASAFITTPFVPSTGCNYVAKSNPGAWMIIRPDTYRPTSWLPWGKLEAWLDRGIKDSVYYRLHLISQGQEGREVVMSEIFINTDKGGEFTLDTDKQTQNPEISTPSPQSSGGSDVGGFVMSCRVQGESKSSKPLVQLAARHIMCVEDAAIFMALAAAVDLSIVACRPFSKKTRRRPRFPLP